MVNTAEKPSEIDDVTWEHLLSARTEKIKSELEVSRAMERLKEAERRLTAAQAKNEKIKQQLDMAIAQLLEFKKQQTWDTHNLEMLFTLKQGQVVIWF